jgi:hypothetical protein
MGVFWKTITLDLSPCNHDLWETFIRLGESWKKHMACKVTYLLNAYDIFTSFILNINQTCRINFAYRLWREIYLFILTKCNVQTIIISSMNAIIRKHGLRNQKVICCMSMIFMFLSIKLMFFIHHFHQVFFHQRYKKISN